VFTLQNLKSEMGVKTSLAQENSRVYEVSEDYSGISNYLQGYPENLPWFVVRNTKNLASGFYLIN